jgi:hypothetical protein
MGILQCLIPSLALDFVDSRAAPMQILENLSFSHQLPWIRPNSSESDLPAPNTLYTYIVRRCSVLCSEHPSPCLSHTYLHTRRSCDSNRIPGVWNYSWLFRAIPFIPDLHTSATRETSSFICPNPRLDHVCFSLEVNVIRRKKDNK